MNRLLSYLVGLAVFCTIAGCGKSKDEPLPEPAPSGSSLEFENNVTPTLVADAEGGISTLTFIASGEWTAEVNAVTRTVDWVKVSPASGGAGMVNLQITTQPNDTYDERNAAIRLCSGSTQKVVTITQKQKDGLLLTSNKVELDATGGEFVVELKANVTVTAEIDEAARSWLTAIATRGLTSSMLRFTAAENEDLKPRQAVIILKGNDLTEKVTVYQTGKDPSIVLSQKEYTVSSIGETIQVELKSNTAYKVVMPADAPWISEVNTRSFSAYTHYYWVAPNDTYDTRTAEIRFVDEVNGLEEKVIVMQMQQDAILVAQNEYIVEAAGGTLDFSVNANVDFTVETSVDWIQQVGTRGLVGKQLSFSITENTNEVSRRGLITIRSGELIQEIWVTQEPREESKEYYIKILSAPMEVLSTDAQHFEIKVESNTDNVYMNMSFVDWLWMESSSREESVWTYTFTLQKNVSEMRSVDLNFVNEIHGLWETVTVTQGGSDDADVDSGIEELPTEEW